MNTLIIIVIILLIVGTGAYFMLSTTPSSSQKTIPSSFSKDDDLYKQQEIDASNKAILDSYNSVNKEVEKIINDRQTKKIELINLGKEIQKSLGETKEYKDLSSKINDKTLTLDERNKSENALNNLITNHQKSQSEAINKYNTDIVNFDKNTESIRKEIIEAQNKYPRDFESFNKEKKRILETYETNNPPSQSIRYNDLISKLRIKI
jgi:hypothetical protein